MSFPFSKGDMVEVVECPPESFGYGDYVITKGTFETWDNEGGLAVVIISDDGTRHLINMQASTIVEIRSAK